MFIALDFLHSPQVDLRLAAIYKHFAPIGDNSLRCDVAA
jgi:hypothetical protein